MKQLNRHILYAHNLTCLQKRQRPFCDNQIRNGNGKLSELVAANLKTISRLVSRYSLESNLVSLSKFFVSLRIIWSEKGAPWVPGHQISPLSLARVVGNVFVKDSEDGQSRDYS